MAEPKGYVIVPVAFRADGTMHALELDNTDQLKVLLSSLPYPLNGVDNDGSGSLKVYVTGGVSMPNALLDGVVHTDTELSAPTIGSLIGTRDIGGGNYRWTRFAPGSLSQILVVQPDGTLAWQSGLSDGDGWMKDTKTWTYASATTFTVPGNVTTQFTKGTRIKLTNNGSTKYFVVINSVFGTQTTVTVTGGDDYSLANAAITSPYYSYQASPQGYPPAFNWTPGFTGFSANPTVTRAQFSIIGDMITINYEQNANGTSNATTFTITNLPVTVAGSRNCVVWFLAINNGAAVSAPGYGSIATNIFTCNLNGALGAWTNINAKGARIPVFSYNY